MIHIQRKLDQIWMWDYEGRNPIILEHDEAVDLANQLLDAAGHMTQEKDEEIALDV